MSEARAAPGSLPQETPLSLYIELEEGTKPDIEVVARAALAFGQGIREAAFVIDPSLEVRVQLVSGSESSLSLNSLIRAKSVRDLFTWKRLLAVAFTSLLWFRMETARWTFDKVLNYITENEEVAHHL